MMHTYAHETSCAILLFKLRVMEQFHHCFNCRYADVPEETPADVQLVCVARDGFHTLRRDLCYGCYEKQRTCICGDPKCEIDAIDVQTLEVEREELFRSKRRVGRKAKRDRKNARKREFLRDRWILWKEATQKESLQKGSLQREPLQNDVWQQVGDNWQMHWQRWCDPFQ